MLSRIVTGAILSVGCVLAAQAVEIALDKALEEFEEFRELNAVHAAPSPDVAAYPDCLGPGPAREQDDLVAQSLHA